MLTSQGFETWITALADRWFPLSKPAKVAYWHHLHAKFETDEEFAAVCIDLFALEQRHYSSPGQFLEALGKFKAAEYQPPALPAAPEDYTMPSWWHEYHVLYRHFHGQGWRWIQHSPDDLTVFVLERETSSVVFLRTANGWESESSELNRMVQDVLAKDGEVGRTEPADPETITAKLQALAGQPSSGMTQVFSPQ